MRPTNRSFFKTALRWLTGFSFVAAGVLHFMATALYARIVPSVIPWPHAIVLISGVAEIAGGIGLLVERLRRVAGWGLIALLIAVFPANVTMAVHADRFADLGFPLWALWARLPMQALMIAWVWWVALREPRGQDGQW